ncbi:hypothetical protein G4G27_01995 [Sphingomonas sp. So64.6b]|uniref:NosD domain-containing protein n=1 Tax=Sphingomonas sp. So64.6b TaxID=2997354 RepID=UPI00160379AA|nr:NosD domain-containing protein [Sphingomonas sp. So64.6b]QNA82917.1 hypothetical protein G4G27_01995 [Sphingomonas sp. So64.6b]
MTIYQRPGTSIVRDMDVKVSECEVSVRDWGAVGDYTTDDTAAIQACLDNAPLGSTVCFPANASGSSGIAQYRVTQQLNITRQLSLRGEQSRIVGVFAGVHVNDDLLRFSVPLEIRNVIIEQLTLNFNSGGRHAIYIGNASGNGALGWVIRDCSIAAGANATGRAIMMEYVGTHFNRIYNNQIAEGGVHLKGADGTIIEGNLIFGKRCGVIVELVNGAYKTQICKNGITSRDGGVYLKAAQQVDIENNQFEQGIEVRDTNINGFLISPGNAAGSHIIAYGGDELVRDIRILGNNFGSGTNQESAISLVGYTRDILIDENVFASLGTTSFDVRIFSPTCQYTVIGNRNRMYGLARAGLSSRTQSNTLDPKKLLLVSDGGKGTYGYAARKIKTVLGLQHGWDATADFSIWKDEDDRLHTTGALIHGTNLGGTLAGVLPVTMRPASGSSFYWHGAHNVATSNLQTRLYVVGATGEIYVETAEAPNVGGGGSSPTLSWMHPTPAIQGRTDYLSGPV